MIIKQLELGSDKVFCYIAACGETCEAVVIDPCGDEDKLLGTIKQLHLTVLYIINTHCHPDHTCSNQAVRKATGALIVRHEADELLLQEPEAAEYFARQGFPPSPPADKTVKDGDCLALGRYSWADIHWKLFIHPATHQDQSVSMRTTISLPAIPFLWVLPVGSMFPVGISQP
jgi:glyoxylase-like metal-dependent hydrolase (beta-lactamase superfamily II)